MKGQIRIQRAREGKSRQDPTRLRKHAGHEHHPTKHFLKSVLFLSFCSSKTLVFNFLLGHDCGFIAGCKDTVEKSLYPPPSAPLHFPTPKLDIRSRKWTWVPCVRGSLSFCHPCEICAPATLRSRCSAVSYHKAPPSSSPPTLEASLKEWKS